MRFSKVFTATVQLALVAGLPTEPLDKRSPSWGPPHGQTFINIGQNYHREWHGFASHVKTPAGISVYGDIWSGALNPDSQSLLTKYAADYNGFVEVGMSWKDAMTLNGYTEYQGAQLCHDIANGKYDNTIGQLASYLKGFPNVKYLLRVDYEVSGNMFANTNPTIFDTSTFDYSAYPAAFAHVRQLMSGIVDNIQFVFHPVRGDAASLYPGDSEVDWQGFSIFNNDVCLTVDTTTNCVGEQLDPNILIDIQFADAHGKPKIVAESTVQPASCDDASGIIEYLTRVKNMVEKYDFQAWTYINSRWRLHGWDPLDWGDSRVWTNPEVLQWYMRNIASNPRYVFEGGSHWQV